MSKIGQKPIAIPTTVEVQVTDGNVQVKGKDGQLEIKLPHEITAAKEGTALMIGRKNEKKASKSLHGLFRNLIANAVQGVEKPWERRLEVVGTGFNVKAQGEDLALKVGYSHLVIFKKQEGIKYRVEGNNKIVVSGIDKQKVGQVAYQLKMVRKPDAYKGKGIRYEGEKLKLKPGKKAKTATA